MVRHLGCTLFMTNSKLGSRRRLNDLTACLQERGRSTTAAFGIHGSQWGSRRVFAVVGKSSIRRPPKSRGPRYTTHAKMEVHPDMFMKTNDKPKNETAQSGCFRRSAARNRARGGRLSYRDSVRSQTSIKRIVAVQWLEHSNVLSIMTQRMRKKKITEGPRMCMKTKGLKSDILEGPRMLMNQNDLLD